MTVPTTTTRQMLSTTLTEMLATFGAVKTQAVALRGRSLTGSLQATEILEFHLEVKTKLDRLNMLAAVPGLAQYAKDQFDDQVFDVATEFNTTKVEIVATLDWIRLNLPTGDSETIEADNSHTFKTFTSGQTASLRTQLDALIATIG